MNEVVASLPRRERTKIEARARALIAEEMSLRDLRKAIGKTQAAVAQRLGIGQEAVSRLTVPAAAPHRHKTERRKAA